MTTDIRALCAELADRLQRAITSSKADRFYGEDRDALDRASAALAEGAGVGVTEFTDEKELIKRLADCVDTLLTAWPAPIPEDHRAFAVMQQSVAEARVALARYGTSHPRPIPATERLPTEADCAPWPDEDDIEPWCWQFKLVDDAWEITQASRSRLNSPMCADYTHWLPAAAIPLPKQESIND